MTFDNRSSNNNQNIPNQQNTSQNNQQAKQDPEDSETVIYNKKKLICDILKQALNAKMTAAGMLYRDLFSYMQAHVNSYNKNKQAPSQNQNNNQEKTNANPNKQPAPNTDEKAGE